MSPASGARVAAGGAEAAAAERHDRGGGPAEDDRVVDKAVSPPSRPSPCDLFKTSRARIVQ